MAKKEKIILIGGGGHCKVVIDAITLAGNYKVCGVVDPKLEKGSSISGVPVLGNDDILMSLHKKGVKAAFITVGSIGDCGLRKRLYERAKKLKFSLPVIAHPSAVIARDVMENIGEGTFIAASATINPGTVIGKNVIINTSSSIDHDCRIGDNVHIAPGAILSGGVEVGEEAHIGTGVNVTQYLRIEKGDLVKAGTVVYRSTTHGTVVKKG